MAVAGVPPMVFVVVGLIDLLYQFWIHTELVGKLGWFDYVFASPSNHRVHHGINDRYLDKNYGGILILWDRLFGTFEEEVEKPVFGVRGGLFAFDPLSANVAYYRTMAKLAWAADDWRDRLRVWFAPPGWVPANMRTPGPPPPFDLAGVETYDPPATPLVSLVAFAALIALVGATAFFLTAAPGWPWATGLVVFLAIVAWLWAVGALLDRRLSIAEALYVFCAALTCAAYALGWSGAEAMAKPLTLALLIVAFALRDGPGDVKRLVLGGLVAALAGDALLLSPSLFLPGLAAFALTHLFYIGAFSRGVGFLPSRVAALVVAVLAVLMFVYLWPGVDAGLRLPVAIYVAVIACDAAQACGRATVLRNKAALAVAIGALFFMASDLTLALYKFAHPGWPVDLWTLPTYYVAQGLIAFFVLPRSSAGAKT
jgi:alkylglycerol monooxygenase